MTKTFDQLITQWGTCAALGKPQPCHTSATEVQDIVVTTKAAVAISVKTFGAVGDGVTDDTAAIQAAIDYAVYQTGLGNPSLGAVYIPGGIYKISDALQLGYGENFHSVHLFGDGKRNAAFSQFSGTAIVPTFNDRPAIAVNGGRYTTIRHLSIIGKMVSYVSGNGLGAFAAPSINDLVAANWIDPGFPANSSSRYAPYCGIAIDPYGGSTPSPAYPNVTFPSWSGITSQYNKFLSSGTMIDDVEIQGFVAGIVIQPNADAGNGDFTKINQCSIQYCQYAVSITNTQSRLVRFSNGQITNCYTAFATDIHGEQLGDPQLFVDSSDIEEIIHWMHVPNTAFGNGVRFLNCYGENIYDLGLCSGGIASAQSPVVFEGCEFNFTLWATRGTPTFVFNNNGVGGLVFKTCSFSPGVSPSPTTFYVFNNGSYGSLLEFDNCTTQVKDASTKFYEKHAMNATCGIVIANLVTDLSKFSVNASTGFDLNAGTTFSPGLGALASRQTARNTCIPIYTRQVLPASNTPDYSGGFLMWNMPFSFSKTNAVTITTSGATVTADYTGVFGDSDFIMKGGEVGDVVYDDETQAAFIVSSRTAAVLTLVAQTNLTAAGNLAVAPTKTGQFHVINCRLYTFNEGTIGSTTAGNATMSGVGWQSGFSGDINSAGGGVQVNDFVLTNDGIYAPVTNKNSAKITAVDNVAGTITINGTFRFTTTNQKQTLFVKAAPANGT